MRVADTLLNHALVAWVEFEGNDLAEVAHDAQVPLPVLFTVRNDYLCALLGCARVQGSAHATNVIVERCTPSFATT